MAITDLKAYMKAADTAPPMSYGTPTSALDGRIASLEQEFRSLREECARTRNLIEESEQRGRSLVAAYKHVICDFAHLFEAQRKESRKRDEAVRSLLSSMEMCIRTDLEQMLASNSMNEENQGRWGLFRRKS